MYLGACAYIHTYVHTTCEAHKRSIVIARAVPMRCTCQHRASKISILVHLASRVRKHAAIIPECRHRAHHRNPTPHVSTCTQSSLYIHAHNHHPIYLHLHAHHHRSISMHYHAHNHHSICTLTVITHFSRPFTHAHFQPLYLSGPPKAPKMVPAASCLQWTCSRLCQKTGAQESLLRYRDMAMLCACLHVSQYL